jgi:hypothetical protein
VAINTSADRLVDPDFIHTIIKSNIDTKHPIVEGRWAHGKMAREGHQPHRRPVLLPHLPCNTPKANSDDL